MLKSFKHATKTILKERFLSVLIVVFLFECLVLLAYVAAMIKVTELQVVVHYTGYGLTNFYRDKWVYLLSFIGFIVFVGTIYTLVIYRMLVVKGVQFAIAFTWLGVALMAIAAAMFYRILTVASLS